MGRTPQERSRVPTTARRIDRDALAVDFDEAFVRAVLRQPRVIHEGARALRKVKRGSSTGLARAVKMRSALMPCSLSSTRRRSFCERLDHFDGDRPDLRVHPLHVQQRARHARLRCTPSAITENAASITFRCG